MGQREWRISGGSSPVPLRASAVAHLRPAEEHRSLQKESAAGRCGQDLPGAQENPGTYEATHENIVTRNVVKMNVSLKLKVNYNSVRVNVLLG